MENNPRLKLTRIRLDGLKKCANLEKLAIQTIAKDIIGPKGKPLKSIKNLSPPLRQAVLQELMELKCPVFDGQQSIFDKIFGAFELLLSPEVNIGTHFLKLDNFLGFCSEECTYETILQVLDLIKIRAPNIRSLAITQMRTIGYKSARYTLDAICKLQKLNKLEITSVSFASLKEICKQLPALRHVDVEFSYCSCNLVKHDVDEFKSALGLLTVFLFRGGFCKCQSSFSVFCAQLYRMCMQHLPNLEVAQDYFYSAEKCCCQSVVDYVSTERALRHLSVPYPDLKRCQHFPHVTHLKVHFCDMFDEHDSGKFEEIGDFAQIKGINLERIPTVEHLLQFLIPHGKNLQTLVLSRDFTSNRINFDFGAITDTCPKLEQLHLINVEVEFSNTIQPFPSLKELEWQPCRSACLSGILSAATKLERLRMTGKYFNPKDLRKASFLLARKKILRELTSFRFKIFPGDPYFYASERVDTVFKEFLEAFKNFTKSACAYLPKLIDVNLNFASVMTNFYPPEMNVCPVLMKIGGPLEQSSMKILTDLGHPDLALVLKEFLDENFRECSANKNLH